MMNILWNAKTWVAALAIIFVLFIKMTLDENDKLKLDLQAHKTEIVQLENNIKQLEIGQVLIKEDIESIDKMREIRTEIHTKEIQVRQELDEIPETLDAPFSDGNNLRYAQRLRQHQNSTIAELTGDNGN